MTEPLVGLIIDGFDRVAESVPAVLEGLDADEVARQPAPGANSIGWLVWHLARVEDAQVAPFDQREQVWDDGWHERIGLPYPVSDTGYGHSTTDVSAFRAQEPQLLAEYYAAVHAQTVEVLNALESDDFERVIDPDWDPPVTIGVRLVSVLDDVARHVGQAEYVRGILD